MACTLFAGLAALAASSKESTQCEYSNVTAGTATCGSYNVSVKALVCGDAFDIDSCSTEWVNDVTKQSEVYFFTTLKDGLPLRKLPPACAGLATGLSVAQYLPAERKCTEIGWVQGSSFYYVPDASSKTPLTVTLNFTDFIGPNDLKRDSYIEITCTKTSTPSSPYSTDGDSTTANVYALNVQASCAGAAAPISPSYRCMDGTCVEQLGNKSNGVTWSSCAASCKAGPPPPPLPSNVTFHCHHENRYNWMCVRNQTGSQNRTACDASCQAPPQRYLCLGGECTKTNKSNGVAIDECKAACTAPGPGMYVCKADTCQKAPSSEPGVNLTVCEDICFRPSPPPHRNPHPHHHPPTSASANPESSVAPWLIPLAAVVFMVPCTAMWIRYWIRKNIGEAGATVASTHAPPLVIASEGSTQTSPQSSPQSSPSGGNIYE